MFVLKVAEKSGIADFGIARNVFYGDGVVADFIRHIDQCVAKRPSSTQDPLVNLFHRVCIFDQPGRDKRKSNGWNALPRDAKAMPSSSIPSNDCSAGTAIMSEAATSSINVSTLLRCVDKQYTLLLIISMFGLPILSLRVHSLIFSI